MVLEEPLIQNNLRRKESQPECAKPKSTQPCLREGKLGTSHAVELQAISRLLDDHPRIEQLVLQDLRAGYTPRK